MRIERVQGGSQPTAKPVSGKQGAGAKAAAQPTTGIQTGAAEGSEFRSQLNEIPEVRAEVVEEVRQRLNDGELLTRDAAEKTAEAILTQILGEVTPSSS